MTRRSIVGRLAFALALLALPALAQDDAQPGGESASLVCVNGGSRYSVGEFACIAACHQQRRLARCDVVSDAASWTYVSDACPSAMINPPWPSDWSEVPAVAAMTPIPLVVNSSAMSPVLPLALAALANQDGKGVSLPR